MTPKNIALEPELLARAGKMAEAEGRTVDDLANEAVRRDLLRRGLKTFVAQNRKDAEEMGLTEADVPRIVDESRLARRR
jgi:predicted transcriptional regulator